MRVVFAGTPEFAVPTLDALAAAGHEIVAVLTQPDRPAGRGRNLRPTPVAGRAVHRGIPVLKPERLDGGVQAQLRSLTPDVIVVAAYGLILPEAVLQIPSAGCLNVHASLLPRWRGAAPIQRAILAGDRETGVTIMRMDAGLDTGPMLLQESIPIAADDTAGDVHDRLAPLGAKMMVEVLARLAAGTATENPQPAEGACYAPRITKDEARLDWTRPAEELARQVRAFNPAPVAWTQAGGDRVRVHRAAPESLRAATAPGTVVDAGRDGIVVAAGRGALRILELQRPGGRVLPARDAILGWNLAGKHFG